MPSSVWRRRRYCVGQLADRLHEEGARAQCRLADRQRRGRPLRGRLAVLVEQLGERVVDHESGEHLGRVVAGAALTVVAREAEHEVARRVGDAADQARLRDRSPCTNQDSSKPSVADCGTTHEPLLRSPSFATSTEGTVAIDPV